MKISKKSIVVVVVVAGLAVGGYYYWKKKKSDNSNTDSTSKNPGGGSGGGNTSMPTFPLRNGSKGDEVKRLQVWLNTNLKIKGQPAITTDGIFGSGTEAALKTVTNSTTMTQDYFNNAKI